MAINLKRGTALLFSLAFLSGCTGSQQAMEKGGEQNTEATTQSVTSTGNKEGATVLTLAEMHVAEHPITKALVYFADSVYEKTEGRVQIDVCPAGIMGSENVALADVRNNSLDMARISAISLAEYCPEYIPISLPYAFSSDEAMWKWADSEQGQELLSDTQGCEGLCWIENGSRCFYANEPINSPEDMQDKIFRVPTSKAMYDLVRAYGAKPVNFDLKKAYKSIQDGEITGAENDIISYDYFANNVVAKYYVKNHHSYAPSMIIASTSLKDKVGEEDYNIILACAHDAEAKSREMWSMEEEKVTRGLIEKGVIIIEPTDEAMEKFRQGAEAVYKNYPDYKDEIDYLRSIN